ncbi:MAG: Zn-dependent hydrolase [Caldilineaceae bacterium SB0665_bin_21]|nr:Zn-dependent hydrolase [Caldilineaceae bacterium SB0665_bin_21]MYC62509.1 Zn-dependent hydrolase [Caldilineaceae bacterium SB0661_bin_34]
MSRQPSLRIDGDRLVRDLETLAAIGADAQGGVTRIAYSQEDREGREWVRAEFAALGLSETTDSAGNDTWVYPGTESGLAPIALGSHTDTVPNGGRYDGALGVLSALAAVRALYQENRRLRHPVEVINFAAEEATMSGATFGSRAMAGTLAPDVVNHRAWDSRTVADHLRDSGLDPDRVTEARRTAGPAAFLELHIEQGRRLETQRKPIGVVEGIAGIRRYEVTVNGYANHAGTTLMQDRQDALVMAAPYILQVKAVAEQHGIVGTVGKMDILPGSPNVIPGQVIINLEIRGLDEGVLDRAERQLEEEAGKLQAAFVQTSNKPPVDSDPLLVQALVAACEDNGFAYARMASGAGHDAMCMADLAPQAMLFVPSRNGVSHSPDEYTPPEDCVAGAQVLGTALLYLDGMLDSGR